MNKRILSIILTLAMLLGIMPGISVFAKTDEEIRDEQIKSVKLLQDLKISTAKDLDIDEPIKRGDFAEMVVRGMGSGEQETADTPFPDVKSDDPRSGYILSAYTQNLFTGYSDGRFDPNGPITYEQLVIVLTRMTGHNATAIVDGGTFSHYMSVAKSSGISKGLPANDGNSITVGEAARAIHKTLTVDILQKSNSVGNGAQYVTVEGENLLTERLDLYIVTGQVTADYYTNLAGTDGLGKNEIEVNRKKYILDFETNDTYIGQVVNLYLTEGYGTVAAIERKYTQETDLYIDSESIDQISNGQIIYKNADGKQQKLNYVTTGYLVKNGRGKASWSVNDLKAINNGTFRFVDSNDDEKYDVIIIEQYKDVVVDRIAKTDMKIYFTKDLADGTAEGSVDLNPQTSNVKYAFVDADGNNVKIDDVTGGMVLSLAWSDDKTVCKIVTGKDSVIGTATSIEGEYINLNGELVKITYALSQNTSPIKLGKEGEFFVNHLGKIIGVSYGSGGYKYAYLTKVRYNENIPSDVVTITAFTDDGKFVDLKAAAKIKINEGKAIVRGNIKNDPIIFKNGRVNPQLVVFETNAEGEVSRIRTAVDGSTMTPEQRYKVFSRDAAYAYTGSQDFATRYAGGNWKLFASRYRVGNDTKVFMIPTKLDDVALFSVGGAATLVADTFYHDIQFFDEDKDGYVGAIIIKAVEGNACGDSSAAGVITKVSTAVDENDENLTMLTIANGSTETNIMPTTPQVKAYIDYVITDSTDTVCADKSQPIALSQLEPGDVIRYNTRSDGRITGLEVLLRGNHAVNAENAPGAARQPLDNYYYGTYSAYVDVDTVVDGGIKGIVPLASDPTKQNTRIYPYAGTILLFEKDYDAATTISPDDISPDDFIYFYGPYSGFKIAVVYR